ncbi:hypothetical protein M2459_000335 [Parabacteroides sp. PF5-5]|nr:hypothetical protein [Parabacteroides sp. PH5-39]MDH6314620.1 hypothetical protein [Parabacteroides sp. PF5-13]MDH6321059.1 hypothetical protein [Parabacteroides sp. PH5-13]MDH6324791.1 hypothetical protein [Parabacteroides sp. PH5-8]MDH6325528.1 hypothetical protein [Parabacteroides sp. PH5-41]MDH6333609.1 hypothetical protein [Parabacteroides sp. PF5-5]MDH6344392.1 hypothetical protein [Parabacteroides sp. PH5-46]MDH6359630.1 hypothetical protein [Parabacteroides sp. PH5-16]MDH6375296.
MSMSDFDNKRRYNINSLIQATKIQNKTDTPPILQLLSISGAHIAIML